MTADDTTDLRTRLSSIQDPLAFLCDLFAHAPVGFQIYRADGHCLLTNRAFRELFGSEPPPEYNVLEDEIARENGILDLIRRAFRGETINMPTIWYDPRALTQVKVTEGRRAAFSSTFFPLRGRSGAIDHVAVAFKDETPEVEARERLEAERDRLAQAVSRLKEAEASLAAAQRIARVGNWEMDLSDLAEVNRNPLRWSDEVFRIFGYEPGAIEVTNENFFRAVHPEDRAMIREAVRGALESGTRYSIDHRIVLPDGSIRYVHEQSDLVLDPETGRAVRMTGTVQDVTERRHLEEQLRQAQKVDALGRLSGGVAHDFNNLLTVILGCAELIQSRTNPTDPRWKELGDILAAGNRAAGLTRQLLAFGRRQIIAPRVVNLNSVLRSMEPMLGRLIGEDIDIRLALDPDLSHVRVDPGQMEQVVLNLAVNAGDAMPRGGRLTVETTNAVLDAEHAAAHAEVTPGRYAMVAITDTGAGMGEDVLAHVFEPFFSTKAEKGTGLGLATVYGIVKQSGGHIGVYSEVGLGTTFKIYFPIVEEPAEVGAKAASRASAAAGGEVVLLVEDEDAVRRMTAHVLERAGYRILAAENGIEALRLAASPAERIDLLVTDVVMPGMSGPDLASRLRRQRVALRVLYMSGYADAAIVHHGVLRPGVRFLQKPFTPDGLLTQVRDALDSPQGDAEGA
jgi:PAS domain S-box-containing protein